MNKNKSKWRHIPNILTVSASGRASDGGLMLAGKWTVPGSFLLAELTDTRTGP